ncbi:MAG: response regulator [Bauldia sp.]
MAENPKAAETGLELLMLEDSEDDAALLARQLQRGGYRLDFTRVDNAADLRVELARKPWDLIVSDYNMPTFTGVDALRIVRDAGIETPFIFVSGTMGEETAVAALKAGAQDYLIKGKTGRLLPAIERELREARARARPHGAGGRAARHGGALSPGADAGRRWHRGRRRRPAHRHLQPRRRAHLRLPRTGRDRPADRDAVAGGPRRRHRPPRRRIVRRAERGPGSRRASSRPGARTATRSRRRRPSPASTRTAARQSP